MGGGTGTFVSPELTKELYRHTEQKGCRTGLQGYLDAYKDLLPAFDTIEEMVSCCQHHVSRAHPCRRSLHINLQEIDEVILEVEAAAEQYGVGVRLVNGVDSNVTLGAWAKGRSSSNAVNRSLQRGCGWEVFGQVAVNNFRLGLTRTRRTTRRGSFLFGRPRSRTSG